MLKLIKIVLLLFLSTVFAQSGIFKSKYQNGNLKEEVSLIDNIYDGTCYWYFENGLISFEKTYSKGKLHGWIREYYQSGLLKDEYYVEMGVKNGLSKSYYDNGALSKVENYKNGVRVKGIKFDFDPLYQVSAEAYKAGNRQTRKKTEEYFCNVDVCPEPVGGMYSIYKNLFYPQDAKLYGLEGIVILLVTISENGTAGEITVLQELGLGCDDAAIRAVRNTKFVPGENNNEIVEADVTLKIEFKLDKETKVAYNLDKQVITKIDQTAEPVDTSIAEAESATITKEFAAPLNKIECEIEVCPEPLGGYAAIENNLDIPSVAKRMEVQGYVIIRAVVDEFGFVRDTKVLKSIGYGCDEAAEFAVLATQFTPGKIAGNEVQTDINIFIEFNLK